MIDGNPALQRKERTCLPRDCCLSHTRPGLPEYQRLHTKDGNLPVSNATRVVEILGKMAKINGSSTKARHLTWFNVQEVTVTRETVKLVVNKDDRGVAYPYARTMPLESYLSRCSARLRDRPISSVYGRNSMFQGSQQLFLAMCQDIPGTGVALARSARHWGDPLHSNAFPRGHVYSGFEDNLCCCQTSCAASDLSYSDLDTGVCDVLK